MGSRMKLVLILLFIGMTGVFFLFHKEGGGRTERKNFLEESADLSEEEGFSETTAKTTEEKRVAKKETLPEETSEEDKESEEGSIYVDVCGFVKKEGVYRLKEGSRVIDAIEAAGGLKKKADRRRINLAEVLKDGSQLYVPKKGETQQNTLSERGEERTKINLNSATKEELMTLTGIGESRAVEIIRYREEKGAFREISDIMKVNGIKQSSFLKIKDQITV